MSAVMECLEAREHHRFEAAGRPYVYLVPSAAIFGLDEVSDAVLTLLEEEPRTGRALVEALADRHAPDQVAASVRDLLQVQAVGQATVSPPPVGPVGKVIPLMPFPLTTMVLNVTNQCNLSCTYCYEYGDDKIVDTDTGRQPKFMTEATARDSVDFMLRESGGNRVVHLTFFGGETLMNFPVLQRTVAYARQQAAEAGKQVDFSLTTNATLLRPEVLDFLVEEDVGVTVSIDGPREVQDKFRVFGNGQGSYDLVLPQIRALLARHPRKPVAARVTLTAGSTLDVERTFHHLTDDVGFHEVGFAPVTAASGREYVLDEAGHDLMLSQFTELAHEYLARAVEGQHHGFSNVRETLHELHKGMSKAFPCGAGLGLLGVSTAGEVALCHRFAGSDDHRLGTIHDGIDRDAQAAFLDAHHIDAKTDCRTCWARPLCAGGCYHEAHTRTGDTRQPNLHYCHWIRGWTDVCLRVYGELAERNPAFLSQFDPEPEPADAAVT